MHAEYKCVDAELTFVNNLVDRFLLNELPGADFSRDENLVDKITSLFMGTRHIRLAGCPSPESQVLMRSVIRTAIERNVAIPVLSAAGPKKSNSGQIDLAEFSAMQKLVCLQERVRKYYAPGMSFRVRLEDVTGVLMEPVDSRREMNQYCNDFTTLCALLEERIGGKFIKVWRESSEPEQSRKMLELAHQHLPAFERAFTTGDQEGVKAAGWLSGVGQNWKDFLNERYTKLFPHWTQERKDHQAAKYLACTLARQQAGMTGATPEWLINGKHLEISFANPSPGAPAASTRVYYRTMSTKQTKLHMPYWRSKGYFRLVDGVLRMGLSHCGDRSTFVPGKLVLTSANRKTELGIVADFLNQ